MSASGVSSTDETERAVRAAEARFYDALRALRPGNTAPLLDAWSHADDVTTLNGAGGHERGWAAVRGRWEWWADKAPGMGSLSVEPLAFVAIAGLAYTAALEHYTAATLRVTHVYRYEGTEDGGAWKLIHRHADRLAERRDPPS